MKAKWIFSFITIVTLVLALTPGMAFAAESDNAAGTFGCANSAPAITGVSLHLASNDAAADAMTPLTEYYVQVGVSDANTLDDLATVKVYIYYDALGGYDAGEVPSSGATNTCAILTWTNADTWSIDPSSSTTWTQETSTVPTLTGASGNFKFNFKPGKVATETTGAAKWHIHVVADDGTAAPVTGNQTDRTMNWYGEVTVGPATIDWGNVDAGLAFDEDTDSEQSGITVTYVSNGDYSEKIAATATWDAAVGEINASLDADGTPSSANSFSLKADDTGTLSSAVVVNTTSSYTDIDTEGTITGESGNAEDANSVWLALNDTFVIDVYTGAIYYQIANR